MRLLAFAACFVACVPNLTVPEGTQIRCDETKECPAEYECISGACVSTKINGEPRVSMLPLTRSLGAIGLQLIIADKEGNPVSVDIALRTRASGDFFFVKHVDGLGSSPGGTPSTVELPDANQILADHGCPGFCSELAFLVTPSDSFGPGAAVVSSDFSHGNDAPEVMSLTLDDAEVSGNVVMRFLLADSAADAVSFKRFEVSRSGDFSDAVEVPLTIGAMTSFPGGIIAQLPTTPAGVLHNVTWDSRDGAAYSAPNARVRLSVVDSLGAESTAYASPSFFAHNTRSAPTLTVTPVTNLSTTVTTPVQLSILIEDADDDLCTLFVSYSLDGMLWKQAASGDRVVALEPGVAHAFTWSIGQLPPAFYPAVSLRVEVSDSQVGEVLDVGPFALDTSVSSTVDASPPNNIAPANDSIFRVQEVTLQWTSRLGATSYEVQTSTDAAFGVTGTTAYTGLTDTQLTLTIVDDQTYYWRVRANVTTPAQYSNTGGSPAYFHRLNGTGYVYCEANDDECSDAGQVGNRSRPFRRLGTALDRASVYGLSEVRVAARGSGKQYGGIIKLADGVSLRGGYDSTFNEALRAPTGPLNQTIINGGTSLVYGTAGLIGDGVGGNILVEGFHLQSQEGLNTFALRLVGCPSVTLRHCTLEPAPGGVSATGAELQTSGVAFENVWIHGGLATNTAGITMFGASEVHLDAASQIDFRGGNTSGSCIGIDMLGADHLTIAGAQVHACDLALGNRSAGVRLLAHGAVATVSNATISGGDSAVEAHAILVEQGELVLSGSTLSVTGSGGATREAALQVSQGARASISQSSFIATDTAGQASGIFLDVGGSETVNIDHATIVATAPTAYGLMMLPAMNFFGHFTITHSSASAVGSVDARGCYLGVAGIGIGDVLISHSKCSGLVGLEVDAPPAQVTVSSSILSGNGNSLADAVGLRWRSAASGSLVSNNLILAHDSLAISKAVEMKNTTTVNLTNNTVVSGAGPLSAGVWIEPGVSGAGNFTRNIVRTEVVGGRCFSDGGNGNASAASTIVDPLLLSCPTLYQDNTDVYNVFCSGLLGRGTCTGFLAGGTLSGATGSTTAATFVPGFAVTNFATWALKPFGAADRNSSGLWDAGDYGADAANAGPQ